MTESFQRASEARQHDRHALRNWQTEFKAVFVTEETDCSASVYLRVCREIAVEWNA